MGCGSLARRTNNRAIGLSHKDEQADEHARVGSVLEASTSLSEVGMRRLLGIATVVDGLLAGASVDQSVEQLPA